MTNKMPNVYGLDTTLPTQRSYVGGYKQSGVGRENGLQAVEHYSQIKTIYTNLGGVEKTY